MRTKLLLMLLLAHFSIYAQHTSIPDLNFEKKLISLGIDTGVTDGKVLTSSISSLNDLNLYGAAIQDLTGIQDFKSLTDLNCMSNNLSDVDLSQNFNLKVLNLAYNKLTTIDISKCDALENLSIFNNYLTSLDASHNINLKYLSCSSNQLSSINVSENKKLFSLDCSSNQLTNLDLSKNTSLNSIFCTDNLLSSLNLKNSNNTFITATSIDLRKNPSLSCILVDNALYSNSKWSDFKDITANFSALDCSLITAIPDIKFEEKLIELGIDNDGKNGVILKSSITTITSLNVVSSSIKDLNGIQGFTVLKDLNCSDNLLSSLDLSKNTALKLVNCKNNSLESLNLKNGNNTNFDLNSIFTENPNLSCIQVDNDIYATDNWTTLKDLTANYSLDCNRYTLIPDTNFEDKLIALEIDKDGKNGKILTSSTKVVTYLDLTNANILDMTGIEDFTSLTYLDCNYNHINSINVSKNVLLTKLALHDNKLTNLDVSANKQLFNLTFSKNQISTIDLSQNKNLHYLVADRNLLNNLDISLNTQLESLYCGENNLTTLDVSNQPNLLQLNCTNTTISSIDVSSNKKLENLYFNNAQLTTLDVSNNTLLKRLNVSWNQLTTLDLSNNPLLELVFIEFNPLTTLNLKNGNNENFILPPSSGTDKKVAAIEACSFLNNKNLTCIQVDNVEFSNANWTKIKEPTAAYSSTCKNLSIEDSFINKLVLYPNPTKGELNINNISLEKATVYNSLGKLVKSFTLNSGNTNNTLNLSGLPKGVYYVYLINQDAASAKKVIIE